METILYQGRKVQVQTINEINVRRGEGIDFLLRDARGRYYFRRETYDEPYVLGLARQNPAASNYRCLVHRISLRAAVLFQVDFAADQQLRVDTVRILAGNKPRVRTAPGRIVVELDELASAMLRKVCREGDECRHPGEDPRDLVNAAVTFFLAAPDNAQHGSFALDSGNEALARAKSVRLAAGKGVAA